MEDLLHFVQNNWEVCFLYGIKYLKDISDNLNDLKAIVKVHDAEIRNLKENNV